jgi:hypothetical protein
MSVGMAIGGAIELKAKTGEAGKKLAIAVQQDTSYAASTPITVTLTEGWNKFYISPLTLVSPFATVKIVIRKLSPSSSNNPTGVYIRKPQLSRVDTATNILPEYLYSLASFGSGAAGLKYSGYEVTNSVDGSDVLTVSAGDTIDTSTIYLLVEAEETNNLTYSDDLSNAAWTKTNCTATYNQIGIAGVSNAASLITATGADATCLRASALTIASDKHSTSWHIKRSVGTGSIYLTLDNGSTWQDITSQVTTSYTRISIDQTLANPQVGLKLAVSGDAVIVGNASCRYSTAKEVAVLSSPIKTVAAAVTRAVDSLDLSGCTGYAANNETRFTYADGSIADVDDWDWAVTPGRYRRIVVYAPGSRPA